MKKIKTGKRKQKSSIVGFLRLNESVILQNELRIEINGNTKMLVEGYESLCEYSEDYVKIAYKKGSLTVLGKQLCLENMSDGSVNINGKLLSVEFCAAG